jgi:hypothetical protein
MAPMNASFADRIGVRTTPFPHPIEQRVGQRSVPLLQRLPLRPQAVTGAWTLPSRGRLPARISLYNRLNDKVYSLSIRVGPRTSTPLL